MSAFRSGCAPKCEVFSHPGNFTDCKIYYLDVYYPYWEKGSKGEKKNPKFNHFGRMVLDVKGDKTSGVNHFVNWLNGMLSSDIAIAVVPSHEPNNKTSGLYSLAAALANSNRVDASSCLVRHTEIPKLAHGGDRGYDQHIESIKIKNEKLIRGTTVVLLDDTTTTGNSMMACKTLLLDSGASKVVCLALGRSVRD